MMIPCGLFQDGTKVLYSKVRLNALFEDVTKKCAVFQARTIEAAYWDAAGSALLQDGT
jgi:hypothetical protein